MFILPRIQRNTFTCSSSPRIQRNTFTCSSSPRIQWNTFTCSSSLAYRGIHSLVHPPSHIPEMQDTDTPKPPMLDPSSLASLTTDMDRQLLHFATDDAQDYHGHQSQTGMDSLLQTALLNMPPYPLGSEILMSAHDSSATSAHPPPSMFVTHLPQDHQLDLFPHLQQLTTATTATTQQASASTQMPPHGYLHHPVLPSSTQAQTQAILASRHSPVGLRPMSNSSSAEVVIDLPHQHSYSHSNSPEQSPSVSRPDRLGRLGSHGGAGRRIILASGGPAGGNVPLTNGVTLTGAAGHNQATKDASGKFPCVHCNKTYLHLKHLKRHLLRHTGDRPYQCVLCKDTFSRSDILKRHFQKCSIRRGNPGNLTHLAHAHDHQRRKPKGSRDQGANIGSPIDNPNLYSPGGSLISRDGSHDSPKSTSTQLCIPCIRSELRCDGRTPCCFRCSQLGTECVYEAGLQKQPLGKDKGFYSISPHRPSYIKKKKNKN